MRLRSSVFEQNIKIFKQVLAQPGMTEADATANGHRSAVQVRHHTSVAGAHNPRSHRQTCSRTLLQTRALGRLASTLHPLQAIRPLDFHLYLTTTADFNMTSF